MGSLFKKTPKLPEVNQNEQLVGEYMVRDGKRLASRVWDPQLNAYTSQINTSPWEQQTRNLSEQGIANIAGRIGQINDPARIQSYVNAYKAPQVQALNDSYDQARGNLVNNATAMGMSNSAGFGGFLANQIEKNRAQGMADIENNAKLFELDAPNKMLAPEMNLYNLYNSALTGANANALDFYEPALQGSTSATSSRMNAAQLAQSRAMNQAQLKQSSGGGFFSRLLGF